MKEITNTSNSNEVVTLNKTKLNSFKAELTKVTKSMTKLSILAFQLASTPETKKVFIEEVGKMGMSRTTAYALINAGHAIDTRKALENTEYSKVAEIGKIDEIESNIEVFEGEIETPIEEYAGKKSQKEIRNDVKNFNKYGTITPPTEESEPDETESEPETETTNEPFTDLETINTVIAMIGSIVTESEDEELVMMLENATHILVSATDYLTRKENPTNE